ncbi:hypothetical protein VTP01DRAFT_7278 [Rhizomucor pusillus]|uniref:uncharacterized protein n=1 Tax=Rhizomucor pusillus TaxID=4840 RepID=UPI0037443275
MTRYTITSCFAPVRFKRDDGFICSRPCWTLYFFRHTIKLGERYVPKHFAFVEWLFPYPQIVPSLQKLNLHAFGSTCAPLSKESILPVHRLYSGVAVQDLKIDNIYAIIVIMQVDIQGIPTRRRLTSGLPGVVGYHVCLTHRRSPVRIWRKSILFRNSVEMLLVFRYEPTEKEHEDDEDIG